MNVRDIIKHLKSIDSDSRYSVGIDAGTTGVLVITIVDTTVPVEKDEKAKGKKGGK